MFGIPGGDGPEQGDWGRLAQALRVVPAYRQARRVFVGPAPVLAQIRINVLIDGKELLMPAPGLKDGFYLCRPYAIPFRDLAYATTYRGVPRFGQLLDNHALAKTPVDLLVTDAVAVDSRGGRLGDGNGFFDLTCAIFAELGVCESRGAELWAVVADAQLVSESLPEDPWDIPLDGVLTPTGTRRFERPERARATLFWQHLPRERIRRMTPLWKLYADLQAD